MKNLTSYFIAGALLLGVGPTLLGCDKKTSPVNETAVKRLEKYKAIDDSVIRAYLVRNKFEPSSYTRTSSGLYIVTLTSNPQGAVAAVGKQVGIRHEGRLISQERENTIFESSYNSQSLCQCTPFFVGDNSRPLGWNEGLALMRQGEHKLLLVPSYLAYSSSGRGVIPPDSPLLFDMVIVTVSR